MDEVMNTGMATAAPQESDNTVDTSMALTAEDAPVDEATVQESAADTGEDTTPPVEEDEPVTEEEGGEDAEDIVYRFNHKEGRVARGDAPQFIQKLLKVQYDYEHKVSPQLDRLRFLAEGEDKDLDTFIADLEKAQDEANYRALLESCGGNETVAQSLLAINRREREERFRTSAQLTAEQEEANRQDLTVRMGEQLAQLQEEFPEIGAFDQLPEAVVQDAIEDDISLLDGYLRYLHRNAKKAAVQKMKQQKAAAASTGSLRGVPDDARKTDDQSAAFSAVFQQHFS